MFSPWFQVGVTMLETAHGVTHRARKKSRDNKYDTLDEAGGAGEVQG